MKLRFFYKLRLLKVAKCLSRGFSELTAFVLQAVVKACLFSWVGSMHFLTNTNEFKLFVATVSLELKDQMYGRIQDNTERT